MLGHMPRGASVPVGLLGDLLPTKSEESRSEPAESSFFTGRSVSIPFPMSASLMIVPFGLFRADQLERRWLREVRPGYAGGGWFAGISAVVGVCGSVGAVSVEESQGEVDTSSGRAFSSAGDGGRDYEKI
jgi:hypothetical protein